MVKNSDPVNKEFKKVLTSYEKFESFAEKKIQGDKGVIEKQVLKL
jgi:hypothetical protein